ncbi:EF-hand domain-containing protein [Salibaculum griseiflavum]|uniref:Calcium-binding protein n=1 Tax=Salibaculum griseiflavum TaxID=1914409 RepID=A0A2V1P4H7_9RHOB|nr:EF-hand domain-containing protein [Salibaculum griseiflavum]PWG16212.1 calcium-binding protein [Salibaculum griseiflavum]
MTRKTPLLIAALTAGFALTVSAEARGFGAGHGPKAQMPSFEEMDLDGNGALTAEEMRAAMQARMQARFEAADTDGDGGLSAEEMTAMMQARMANRMERHLDRADENGDGLLQIEEMQAMGGKGSRDGAMFDRLDSNGDGTLDAEEFAALQDRMGGRMHRN